MGVHYAQLPFLKQHDEETSVSTTLLLPLLQPLQSPMQCFNHVVHAEQHMQHKVWVEVQWFGLGFLNPKPPALLEPQCFSQRHHEVCRSATSANKHWHAYHAATQAQPAQLSCEVSCCDTLQATNALTYERSC